MQKGVDRRKFDRALHISIYRPMHISAYVHTYSTILIYYVRPTEIQRMLTCTILYYNIFVINFTVIYSICRPADDGESELGKCVKDESIQLGESSQQPCSSTSEMYAMLDDSESSNDHKYEIKLLDKDPLLLIYEKGLEKGLETKKVVEILFQPDEEAVARAVPTSVAMNAVFVIDISSPHVMHYKNILADDLGAWMANGTKTQYYRAPGKTRPPITVTKDAFKDAGGRNIYRATRRFYRNKSSPDLQRVIIDLTGIELV